MTPAEIKRLIEITSHPAWRWPHSPILVKISPKRLFPFDALILPGFTFHRIIDGRQFALMPGDHAVPNIDDIGTRAACWAVNSGRDDGSPFFAPGRASIIVSLAAAMRDAYHV